MYRLIFAVLLVCACASSQQKQSASSPQTNQASSADRKAPPVPVKTPASQPQPTTAKQNDVPRMEGGGYPVKILDQPTDWFAAASVILTGFALFYAGRAAKMAQVSAEHLKNAERAWIMVSAEPVPGHGASGFGGHRDDESGNQIETIDLPIRLKYKNDGRTPAWVTARKVIVVIRPDDLPIEPDFNPPNPPFGGWYDIENIPLGVGELDHWDVTPQCDGRAQLGVHVYVYGFVRYTDAFNEPRETRFGYLVRGSTYSRMNSRYKYNQNS